MAWRIRSVDIGAQYHADARALLSKLASEKESDVQDDISGIKAAFERVGVDDNRIDVLTAQLEEARRRNHFYEKVVKILKGGTDATR